MEIGAREKAARGKGELILLGVTIALLLLVRLTFLHEPFERDEGWYATIGQQILRGGIPYLDGIDQKPPGVFYVYAFAIALFGKTIESIRIFTALYATGTLLSVYWLARYLSGPVAGIGAAALFALYSSAPLVQGSSSNSEVIMCLPLVLSVCFFVVAADRRKQRFLAASGLCAGLALLVKTVAAPYVALLLCASLLLDCTGKGLRGRLLDAAVFVAPMLSLALLTVAYFAWHGAIAELIHWNITVPFRYSKGSRIQGPDVSEVLRYLRPELLLPAVLAIPTALWLLFAGKGLNERVVALLLPAAWLGVALPGKYFPHYFIQLYPFLSVLAGIGIALVAARRSTPARVLLVAVCGACFFYYAAKEYEFFFVYTPQEVSMIKYGAVFRDSVQVADYLKARTGPDDYIFQWGFEPELYFYTDRRPPLAFISSTILESMADPGEAVRYMMNVLGEKKPVYIVIQPEWAYYPGLEEILALVDREYRLETTIAYAQIFRRR